ncbi:YihY family inner membrane protein [bacterium]|nr:YihY family inner membrane protein [bacterium]
MTNPAQHAPGSGKRFRIVIRKKLRDTCGPVWGERLFSFLQFWELVVTGFISNRCPVRATALAYTTLLALIPLIAVTASISTGILKSQGEAPIKKVIDKLVEQVLPEAGTGSTNDVDKAHQTTTTSDAGDTTTDGLDSGQANPDAKSPNEVQPTLAAGDTNRVDQTGTNLAAANPNTTTTSTNAVVVNKQAKEKFKEAVKAVDRTLVVKFIDDSLQRVNSGGLGVTGMVGLIVVAIMLFSTIEATFNDIWGVARGRSWVSRIVQYWATVTLGPLIPVVVLSVNIGSELAWVQKIMDKLYLGFLVQFLLEKALPIIILSFGFAFFYQLMPNTKVRWRAAFLGGLTGGILWQLNSAMNVTLVSKGVTYTKIYGSFAVIPVFLVGLYFSWLILLFGAQVAYAFQNRVAYLQEKEAQRINFLGKEHLALRIMTFVGKRFDDIHGVAPSVIDIAQALRISTRLVDDILKSMEAGGLVMEAHGNGTETGYTLTRPLEKISCHDILMTLRTARGERTESVEDDAKKAIDEVFESVLLAEKSVSGKTSLQDLIARLEPDSQGHAIGTSHAAAAT